MMTFLFMRIAILCKHTYTRAPFRVHKRSFELHQMISFQFDIHLLIQIIIVDHLIEGVMNALTMRRSDSIFSMESNI